MPDSNGNLYGATQFGGASGTASGTETVLHSFTGSDGAFPRGNLIADSDGNLYGTTNLGGASGNGTVFNLSSSGTYTVLYTFTGPDGAKPRAGLIADSNGNLYGTTESGGASGNFGVVFELTGTGFCTVPFSAFSAKLAIDLDQNPNHDAFGLLSSFILGSTSNGIDPVAEPVTLQIGSFTAAIPPGSFTRSPLGTYTFIGTINGVNMEVVIQPTGGNKFCGGGGIERQFGRNGEPSDGAAQDRRWIAGLPRSMPHLLISVNRRTAGKP